jgi:SAM-dependent methyltransferase
MVDHHASDAYTIAWDEAAPRLATAATLDAAWYRSVAGHLIGPDDRLAIDIGCGGAGMARAIRQVMTSGLVLAVDGDETVLATAREALGPADATSPVGARCVRADLDDLAPLRAAAPEPADLVWASGSMHHAGDQQRAVSGLAALLGPGGRLALAEGGLATRCLPWDPGVGEPGLEIRLDAAQDRWFAQMRRRLPGSVPMPYGWDEALRRAGLVDVRTRTWLTELPTPLSDADRSHVVADLTHRVDRLRPTGLLGADDLAAWDRLLAPTAPAWLGRRGDLFRVGARTVYIGAATIPAVAA